MRTFNYITVGKILSELKKEGLNLSRATFYRLENKLKFPSRGKSTGAWRVYTPFEAEEIKTLIKNNYNIGSSSVNAAVNCGPLDYLVKLHELKNRGIVTNEEFNLKKRQLLGI